MQSIELKHFLNRPLCPKCGAERVRPVDIFHGQHLRFHCGSSRCDWVGNASLPSIRKKVIYLDTSTVSHIARALRRPHVASPWLDLYQALKKAVSLEVICCPSSSIVETEAELFKYSVEVIRISKEFGNPGLRHQLQVKETQVYRALDKFLSGQEPAYETSLDRREAFHRDVNGWLPLFNIMVNTAMPLDWIRETRSTKEKLRDEFEKIYAAYGSEGLSFDDIRKREARGFGIGITKVGLKSIRTRLGLESSTGEKDYYSSFLPTTFDLAIHRFREAMTLTSYFDAVKKAEEFFMSDYICYIPVADITSRLHAALALLFRGPTPRCPSSGDHHDIEHIATYAPYVDVLVADRFFADLCNQRHVRIGERYGTEIRSLGEGDIGSFIAELEESVSASPQSLIATRIFKAIEEGGFHEDFAKRASEYLRRHGIDPDKT